VQQFIKRQESDIAASQQIVSGIIQRFLGLSICSAPEARHRHTEFPAHLKTSGLLCNFMKPRQCNVQQQQQTTNCEWKIPARKNVSSPACAMLQHVTIQGTNRRTTLESAAASMKS